MQSYHYLAAAQELTMVATLSPLIASNIAAPFDNHIYCSDACEEGGGIWSAEVGAGVRSFVQKLQDEGGLHKAVNSYREGSEQTHTALEELDAVEQPPVQPGRPLAFTFEFIEVFSEVSRVTDYAAGFGNAVLWIFAFPRSMTFGLYM